MRGGGGGGTPSDTTTPTADDFISVFDEPGMRLKHAALLYYMDETIGRIVKEFENHNMWQDTLVVFASDNGGCATPFAPGKR